MIGELGLLAAPLMPLLMMLVWLLPGARPIRGQSSGERRVHPEERTVAFGERDFLGERIAPWAPLPALLVALLLPPGTTLELPSLLLEGGLWALTTTTRPLLLVTALVWLCAGFYARGYLQGPDRQRFWLLWLATLAGNIGLLVAVDIASFYTFFSLMTFTAYALIVHDSSTDALYAGRVYLVMAVVGEVLMLGGLLLAAGGMEQPLLTLLPQAVADSERRDLLMALLIIGFGVKAGLPLLHMWLPLAHPAAPTPASAVLSGAMIKAGLLGWLLTLPLGLLMLPGWGMALITAGLIAAFGAAFVGVTQRQPKAVLAYSSISQMGLMTILVGAGLLAPEQWPELRFAVVFYAVHHGLAKGALFLGTAIFSHAGRLPGTLLWLGLVWPGLVLTGLPLTSGVSAKLLAKHALATIELLPGWSAALLTVAAIGTGALMARFLQCIFLQNRSRQQEKSTPANSVLAGKPSASGHMAVAWGALVLASAAIPLWGPLWFDGSVAQVPLGLNVSDMLTALLPATVVLLLAVLAFRWGRWPAPLPPGDILVPLLVPLNALRVAGAGVATRCGRQRDAALKLGRNVLLRLDGLRKQQGRAEELASRYSGHVFVTLTLLLIMLLLR